MRIENKDILCIIPARAGSKGVKNKNIKKLHSKPLIDYTLDVATDFFLAKNIYISSDSKEIAMRGLEYGLPARELRPQSIAGDKSLTIDAVLSAINQLSTKFKAVCLLQPTSPFRTQIDIKKCIELLNSGPYTSVISVNKIDEPHPNKMKKIEEGLLKPYIHNSDSSMPRQSLESIYALNGCIYLTKMNTIMNDRNFFGDFSAPYLMGDIQSLNINSNLDWMLAEKILEENLI